MNLSKYLPVVFLFLGLRTYAQPKIEFGNTVIDAGQILEGPVYNFEWRFTNTGTESLMVSDVKSTGSILYAYKYDKAPIKPGQQGRVYAVLSTNGWANNRFNKTLLVKTNAKDVVLTVLGFVTSDSLDVSGIPDTFINNEQRVIATSSEVQYNIQPGDILFQDLDCGAACDAIEKVTEGVNGMDFSHCGIVVQMGNEMKVVEAYGAVKATAVNDFLARTKDTAGYPKVVIGRLKDERSVLADETAEIAKEYIGKGYDDAFEMGNDKYYCSELIYECFRKANKNKPFFELNVMTFKEPASDAIMPFWIDYFKKLDKQVPEGRKGINPGAMSRHADLKIVKLQQL